MVVVGSESFDDQVQEDYDESSTEEICSDDSDEDPTFDIREETRKSLSKLSLKKSKSRLPKASVAYTSQGETEDVEIKAVELDESELKGFEKVEKLIQASQLEKLKVEECKLYLRKNGLRLTGNKDVLIARIREHLEIINGGGELKYPASSFVLNCKGDACTGDVVMFEQNVYETYNVASRSATGPPSGTRVVAGRIVKESYGAAKQQHTFTIEVLWSKGVKPHPPLHPLLIKGRNLYRLQTVRQRWDDEEKRRQVLLEKHSRGAFARNDRETRIRVKEMRKVPREQRPRGRETTTTHEQKHQPPSKPHDSQPSSIQLQPQANQQQALAGNGRLTGKENTTHEQRYQPHSIPHKPHGSQPSSFQHQPQPQENQQQALAGNSLVCKITKDISGPFDVFVGDLSPEVTDASLFECFSVYRSCLSARVKRDPVTGGSRGFGFVSFRSEEEAESAINDLNGKWLGGRRIRCNWATKGAGAKDKKQISDSRTMVDLTNTISSVHVRDVYASSYGASDGLQFPVKQATRPYSPPRSPLNHFSKKDHGFNNGHRHPFTSTSSPPRSPSNRCGQKRPTTVKSPPRSPLNHFSRNDDGFKNGQRQPFSPPRSPLKPASISSPLRSPLNHLSRNDDGFNNGPKQTFSRLSSPPRSPLNRWGQMQPTFPTSPLRNSLNQRQPRSSLSSPPRSPLNRLDFPRQQQLCRYYAQGRCHYGSNCKYLHENTRNFVNDDRRELRRFPNNQRY